MQQSPSRYRLNRHTIIHVYGSDASKFLQGQCTVDVLEMRDRTAMPSAICNEKGRIITLFYLLKDDDAFYLILPSELLDITWALLKKYAPFHRKCHLEHISDRWICFSENTPASAVSFLLDGASHGYFYFASTVTPTENDADDAAWHSFMLRKGYARLHPETSLQLLPQELGLTALNAVSFTKGCFTGQAIIARVHYRSDRQYHLLLATIKTAKPSLPLLSEWRSEHLKMSITTIDAIPTQQNDYLALCYSIHEWPALDSPMQNDVGECIAITPLNHLYSRETP